MEEDFDEQSDNQNDDAMSTGDVIRVGSTSEYQESFASMDQGDNASDIGSFIVRNESEYSGQNDEIRRGTSSQWDESSQYTDSNIMVVDGASSYNGSDVVSETTIKQIGASSRGGPERFKSRLQP